MELEHGEEATSESNSDLQVDDDESDGNTSFLRAARDGNLQEVLEYLQGSTDINTSNPNGLNALHLASKEGHLNVVTELLKRGASVEASTKKGNTALHIASLAGHEKIVCLLVESGAKVNVQAHMGFTPLYMAAQEGHADVVKYLLANGASQSLSTKDGFTPLAVALQQGHERVVSVLLESDTKGKVKLPALHIAAKKDDIKSAALLLQNEQNNVDTQTKSGGLVNDTTKSGFTPLHIAAHYGNTNVGSLLIQRGADVNFKAKNNITPLHVSSRWGKPTMVTLLIDNKAIIDEKTRDGLTPLHCAARSGHENVVDLLLERGAPKSAKTKNGLTPLHMAAQGDHVDCARLLLYHRAPVDDVTVDYLTPLHVAAHCGNVKTAKLLLDRKCDPNARALNGFTPLHIACKKNRIKVVELLLKYGASIEATTESGLTPLHVASFMGHMNIVIYLIQNNANPDFTTVRGETALHLAARASQTDIIRILLRNGASVDARAREQQTPLHIAARLGNTDNVTLLLQHNASPDAVTKDLYTPLHIAAKEGHEEVTSVLLDHGSSHGLTTKKGFTPLHIAAKYGNMKVASLLLQKDANPDVQGKNGLTPLHVATHYNHVNVALLLLDHKASPHSTAKNGYTSLHIAAKKNQMDIATTLLEFGAKPDTESKNGFTPIHLAAQEGHTDMVSLLLEHKADVNCKAQNGLTPLHLTAQEDKVTVAEVLVKYHTQIDPQTKAGYTPLHTACHFGQINMVRFLLEQGASVSATTKLGYTPLHQAAQQGHVQVVSLLLKNKASPNAVTNNGQTPLSIAQRLGYISVVDTLTPVTEVAETIPASEDKLKIASPEIMQETLISDSEDEGGEDSISLERGESTSPLDTSYEKEFLFRHPGMSEDHRRRITSELGTVMRYPSYLERGPDYEAEMRYFSGDTLTSPHGRDKSKADSVFGGDFSTLDRLDTGSVHSESKMRSVDEHSSEIDYGDDFDDSMKKDYMEAQIMTASYAAYTSASPPDSRLAPSSADKPRVSSYSGSSFSTSFDPDNVAIDQTPAYSGRLKWKSFLISFMVDARGGAMRGRRHSGVRIIIPPRKASMPTRVTCRLIKKEKLIHPIPLNEGEALAARVIEMGPVGTKFLGRIVIEIPHFASLRGKEREIKILRSNNGEKWEEHPISATDEAVQKALHESIEDLEHEDDLSGRRITRILTDDFPRYFAIVTKIREEKQSVGESGGVISSTVVPQVQAVFPDGALTKKIRVGLQAQPISPDLVSKLLGNRVAVSPIVTVEPRRRKFHKNITLTIPIPKAAQKGMINQYEGDAPNLRVLYSISEGTELAVWDDLTDQTELKFTEDCVSFTTRVSGRFWLMDCQNIADATTYATELYKEAIIVPYMARFVVFAKRTGEEEGKLRMFCMTDDRIDKTLEKQEHFVEVARSRDVEVLEGRPQFVEMAGNLIPITKSGDQLYISFKAFRENRLPCLVKIRDMDQDPAARVAFMKEPKVARGEVPQTPICNLNIALPDMSASSSMEMDGEAALELRKRSSLLREHGIVVEDTISRAKINLSDVADTLKGDWVILATQLDISNADIHQINSDYKTVNDQALAMLTLWKDKNGDEATGNALEKALIQINREDVVKKCMYNVETVQDEVEAAAARVAMDQSGFDTFTEEVGISKEDSMKRNMSLDVQFDEQDIQKESESVAEESLSGSEGQAPQAMEEDTAQFSMGDEPIMAEVDTRRPPAKEDEAKLEKRQEDFLDLIDQLDKYADLKDRQERVDSGEDIDDSHAVNEDEILHTKHDRPKADDIISKVQDIGQFSAPQVQQTEDEEGVKTPPPSPVERQQLAEERREHAAAVDELAARLSVTEEMEEAVKQQPEETESKVKIEEEDPDKRKSVAEMVNLFEKESLPQSSQTQKSVEMMQEDQSETVKSKSQEVEGVAVAKSESEIQNQVMSEYFREKEVIIIEKPVESQILKVSESSETKVTEQDSTTETVSDDKPVKVHKMVEIFEKFHSQSSIDELSPFDKKSEQKESKGVEFCVENKISDDEKKSFEIEENVKPQSLDIDQIEPEALDTEEESPVIIDSVSPVAHIVKDIENRVAKIKDSFEENSQDESRDKMTIKTDISEPLKVQTEVTYEEKPEILADISACKTEVQVEQISYENVDIDSVKEQHATTQHISEKDESIDQSSFKDTPHPETATYVEDHITEHELPVIKDVEHHIQEQELKSGDLLSEKVGIVSETDEIAEATITEEETVIQEPSIVHVEQHTFEDNMKKEICDIEEVSSKVFEDVCPAEAQITEETITHEQVTISEKELYTSEEYTTNQVELQETEDIVQGLPSPQEIQVIEEDLPLHVVAEKETVMHVQKIQHEDVLEPAIAIQNLTLMETVQEEQRIHGALREEQVVKIDETQEMVPSVTIEEQKTYSAQETKEKDQEMAFPSEQDEFQVDEMSPLEEIHEAEIQQLRQEEYNEATDSYISEKEKEQLSVKQEVEHISTLDGEQEVENLDRMKGYSSEEEMDDWEILEKEEVEEYEDEGVPYSLPSPTVVHGTKEVTDDGVTRMKIDEIKSRQLPDIQDKVETDTLENKTAIYPSDIASSLETQHDELQKGYALDYSEGILSEEMVSKEKKDITMEKEYTDKHDIMETDHEIEKLDDEAERDEFSPDEEDDTLEVADISDRSDIESPIEFMEDIVVEHSEGKVVQFNDNVQEIEPQDESQYLDEHIDLTHHALNEKDLFQQEALQEAAKSVITEYQQELDELEELENRDDEYFDKNREREEDEERESESSNDEYKIYKYEYDQEIKERNIKTEVVDGQVQEYVTTISSQSAAPTQMAENAEIESREQYPTSDEEKSGEEEMKLSVYEKHEDEQLSLQKMSPISTKDFVEKDSESIVQKEHIHEEFLLQEEELSEGKEKDTKPSSEVEKTPEETSNLSDISRTEYHLYEEDIIEQETVPMQNVIEVSEIVYETEFATSTNNIIITDDKTLNKVEDILPLQSIQSPADTEQNKKTSSEIFSQELCEHEQDIPEQQSKEILQTTTTECDKLSESLGKVSHGDTSPEQSKEGEVFEPAKSITTKDVSQEFDTAETIPPIEQEITEPTLQKELFTAIKDDDLVADEVRDLKSVETIFSDEQSKFAKVSVEENIYVVAHKEGKDENVAAEAVGIEKKMDLEEKSADMMSGTDRKSDKHELEDVSETKDEQREMYIREEQIFEFDEDREGDFKSISTEKITSCFEESTTEKLDGIDSTLHKVKTTDKIIIKDDIVDSVVKDDTKMPTEVDMKSAQKDDETTEISTHSLPQQMSTSLSDEDLVEKPSRISFSQESPLVDKEFKHFIEQSQKSEHEVFPDDEERSSFSAVDSHDLVETDEFGQKVSDVQLPEDKSISEMSTTQEKFIESEIHEVDITQEEIDLTEETLEKDQIILERKEESDEDEVVILKDDASLYGRIDSQIISTADYEMEGFPVDFVARHSDEEDKDGIMFKADEKEEAKSESIDHLYTADDKVEKYEVSIEGTEDEKIIDREATAKVIEVIEKDEVDERDTSFEFSAASPVDKVDQVTKEDTCEDQSQITDSIQCEQKDFSEKNTEEDLEKSIEHMEHKLEEEAEKVISVDRNEFKMDKEMRDTERSIDIVEVEKTPDVMATSIDGISDHIPEGKEKETDEAQEEQEYMEKSIDRMEFKVEEDHGEPKIMFSSSTEDFEMSSGRVDSTLAESTDISERMSSTLLDSTDYEISERIEDIMEESEEASGNEPEHLQKSDGLLEFEKLEKTIQNLENEYDTFTDSQILKHLEMSDQGIDRKEYRVEEYVGQVGTKATQSDEQAHKLPQVTERVTFLQDDAMKESGFEDDTIIGDIDESYIDRTERFIILPEPGKISEGQDVGDGRVPTETSFPARPGEDSKSKTESSYSTDVAYTSGGTVHDTGGVNEKDSSAERSIKRDESAESLALISRKLSAAAVDEFEHEIRKEKEELEQIIMSEISDQQPVEHPTHLDIQDEKMKQVHSDLESPEGTGERPLSPSSYTLETDTDMEGSNIFEADDLLDEREEPEGRVASDTAQQIFIEQVIEMEKEVITDQESIISEGERPPSPSEFTLVMSHDQEMLSKALGLEDQNISSMSPGVDRKDLHGHDEIVEVTLFEKDDKHDYPEQLHETGADKTVENQQFPLSSDSQERKLSSEQMATSDMPVPLPLQMEKLNQEGKRLISSYENVYDGVPLDPQINRLSLDASELDIGDKFDTKQLDLHLQTDDRTSSYERVYDNKGLTQSQLAQKPGPIYIDPDEGDSEEDEILDYPIKSLGDTEGAESEDVQSHRLMMQKEIHTKTVLKDGQEQTFVHEEARVEQDSEPPEELRDSMQQIIDQFMETPAEPENQQLLEHDV